VLSSKNEFQQLLPVDVGTNAPLRLKRAVETVGKPLNHGVLPIKICSNENRGPEGAPAQERPRAGMNGISEQDEALRTQERFYRSLLALTTQGPKREFFYSLVRGA